MKFNHVCIIAAMLFAGCKSKNEQFINAVDHPETIQELCQLPITRATGKFITLDSARLKLQWYKDARLRANSGYQAKDDIYGFVFGVDKLKELIDKIDVLNADTLNPNPLVGVRVYFAMSREGKVETPDVFLVPVRLDKQNVLPVDDDFQGPITEDRVILNTSVPCPNKCVEK